MERLFITLLNMSLTASWIVGAVVLFRFIFRRAPKWILCLMWGLVALRLVIPGFLQSPTSMLPTTQPVEVPVVYTQPAVQHSPSENFEFSPIPEQPVTDRLQPILTPSASAADQMQEEKGVEQPQLPQVQQAHDTPEKSVFYWCGIIWGIGVCLMIAYCMLSYIRLYLLVREHIPVGKNVYICDKASSPFILGIIRPKIYLPVSLHEEDQKYVLAHEYTHIRRKDHWWKPVGFVLLSIYWFNPAMWLAYILLCRDIEGACDEKVIKELGEEQKKPYSNALINCSAPARLISACPLAFGEGKLRNRIKAVLHYKKPTLWIILVCFIVGIVITAVFLTDPMKKKEQDNNQIEESRYTLIIEDFEKFVSYRLSSDFQESWENGDSILYSKDFERAVDASAFYKWWSMILTMTDGIDEPTYQDFGYVIHDLNQDGVEELFFVRDDHSILAVFTIVADQPVLVDAYWNRYSAVVTDDGFLYCMDNGGERNTVYSIQSLTDSGKLQTEASFYESRLLHYGLEGTQITRKEFRTLIKENPFSMAEFWNKLEISNIRQVDYTVVNYAQVKNANYQVVNNPGPDGQALDLDYPSLSGTDKDYSAINKKIEEVVYNRLYIDIFDGQKLMPEYTKLNYTVTCATDDLISFFYEGTVMVEKTAHPTKVKQGFTFDLQTGRRLYLMDFTQIDAALYNSFLAGWYTQIDEDITVYLDDYTASPLLNLKQSDHKSSENSFYIDQNYLYMVYPVPFAAGGHQTVRLRRNNLCASATLVCHYTASGRLTEQQNLYEVSLYSQKEAAENSMVEVYLVAKSEIASYFLYLGQLCYASFEDGALYVADFDDDGIDEILLSFEWAPGNTETKIFCVHGDFIAVWFDLASLAAEPYIHVCEKHPYPSLDEYKATEDSAGDPDRVFVIPNDWFDYSVISVIRYSDLSLMDIDDDGDYEVIGTQYIKWPDGLENLGEFALNYDEDCKVFIEEMRTLISPDFSQYEVDLNGELSDGIVIKQYNNP